MSVALAASFALIGWAWWSSHQQACESRTTTLNVIRDVILIATTPTPGEHVSAEEIRRALAFRKTVLARVDSARCH